MATREVGHNFLAKLGKKRLRPGGIEATNWLIDAAGFSADTKVLEVACNMCTTSIELAQRYKMQITGIDVDRNALEKAKQKIHKVQLEDYIHVQQGNALHLQFPDNTFDIIINEAMLTMFSDHAKDKAIAEYYRVLKPGGKLLTHDITYFNPEMETALTALSDTINMNVAPLFLDDWVHKFKNAQFSTVEYKTGPMTLMTPKGMLKDEGILNTLKIMWRGRKKENKAMFNKMFTFFNNQGKALHYIAVCSQK